MDFDVTNLYLRSMLTVIAGFFMAGESFASTVLELRYPSAAPGVTPCLYTTNNAGISADPSTGHLLAIGDFLTGCPETGPVLPLPVIVPGPSDWVLPNPWIVGQEVQLQWAAVNASSCTFGGSSATGWTSGGSACSSTSTPACHTLKTVTIAPPAAGTYQFSMTCTNSTGPTTSTSVSRVVTAPVTQPSISGPASWGTLSPWVEGQSKTVNWSATNADSCTLSATTLPSGVTLAAFTNSGPISCSGAAACAANHQLTLTAPVAGTYALNLTCSNSSGGSGNSSNSWTVTSQASSCGSPASGWNRVESAQIFYHGNAGSIGFQDVTTYESIWGRDYSQAPTTGQAPIVNNWPGSPNITATPIIGAGQFVAAKFRTPASGSMGTTLKIDGTTWSLAGGGQSPTAARMSMTVSTQCGDFNTASANIPLGCWKSQLGGEEFFIMANNTPGSMGNPRICGLSPNTDYYLNVIFAPLTSPASAVFNGFEGGNVVQVQNLTSN